MSRELAISVESLGKRYRRGSRPRHNSIRDALQDGVRSLLRRGNTASGAGHRPARDSFWALQDATFDILRGENVGIIGLNGAGKSTLLKILSRIVTPTVGTGRITGRLGALLEVGTGFHAELTGRENIFLYGAILGMTRQEIARKFDAIVDFSEIGEFIDTPVKRYSSGMYVRLAFAVAAHLDPDVLLLDEVLAVGDFAFQRKCMDFAHQLERKGATILFVSHNMFSIKTMCQRVIYLKRGRVAFDGPTDEGLRRYEADSRLAPSPWFRGEESPSVVVTDVELLDEGGAPRTMFDFGEKMRVRIRYQAPQPVELPHFLCSLTRSDEILCCNFSSWSDNVNLPRIAGDGVIELLTPPLRLVSDRYTVSIVVRQHGFQRVLCAQIGPAFHLRHAVFNANAFGVFHEGAQWRLDGAIPLEAANRTP
jgi:lipopolysaccharide transport system ATP-binding protein